MRMNSKEKAMMVRELVETFINHPDFEEWCEIADKDEPRLSVTDVFYEMESELDIDQSRFYLNLNEVTEGIRRVAENFMLELSYPDDYDYLYEYLDWCKANNLDQTEYGSWFQWHLSRTDKSLNEFMDEWYRIEG
jgi:hypothetical protein